MPYIVPAELPKDCCHCPFGHCKFSHPFWSNKKPNTQGYVCSLDKEKRVLEIGFDETAKAEWCPLRFVKRSADFQVEVSSRLEKEIRAEAIKEFSEKLKQQAFECDFSLGFGTEHCTKAVAVIDIDKLIEEMTEGKNG